MASWLPPLIMVTQEKGCDLAVRLSRVAIRMSQPKVDPRDLIRLEYAQDANALIALSHVLATSFATIAMTNVDWKEAQCR